MTTVADVIAGLDAELGGPVTLVVARLDADGQADARKVALANNAADAFRQQVQATRDDLAARAAVPYGADTELGDNEALVIDDPDTVAELGGMATLSQLASTLPTTPANELDLRIQFYAVVIGGTDRVVLVQRSNPSMAPKAGMIFGVAGEQLRSVEPPSFQFKPGFDLILVKDAVVVLNQRPFEQLYRDTGIVDANIRTWVTGITDFLDLDAGGLDELVRVARDDSRTWRKLKEIRRRGHLAGVTVADIAASAERLGVPVDDVVRDGQLHFDPTKRTHFLQLLNEDLYRGDLTATPFEALRKTTA